MVFASVPDEVVNSGLKADEWVQATLEVCGGRGGGKASNAQGQAPECDDVQRLLETANSFASERIGSSITEKA